MSQGATGAALLDECLAHFPGDLRGFAHDFQRRYARFVSQCWLMSTTEEYRDRVAFPDSPSWTRFANWYLDRVHELTWHDPLVALRFLEVMHLQRGPARADDAGGVARASWDLRNETKQKEARMWLTKKQLKGLVGAERLKDPLPVPTRIVSNGEYVPIAQTRDQARVERLVLDMADAHATKAGTGRRRVPAIRDRSRRELFCDESRVRRFFRCRGRRNRGSGCRCGACAAAIANNRSSTFNCTSCATTISGTASSGWVSMQNIGTKRCVISGSTSICSSSTTS